MLLGLKLEDLSRIKTIFMGQSSFVRALLKLRRLQMGVLANLSCTYPSFILEWDECRDGTQTEVLTNENITTARTYTGV